MALYIIFTRWSYFSPFIADAGVPSIIITGKLVELEIRKAEAFLIVQILQGLETEPMYSDQNGTKLARKLSLPSCNALGT